MADTPTSPVVGSQESSGGGGGVLSPRSGLVKEQERFLPIANVSRIMKKGLPTNAKISKEAKDMVQECVSEFISFITSEASDKCLKEKRKTINGDDILWSMATLGFDDYIETLKIYLAKYRELESDTRGSVRSGDGSQRDSIGAFPHQGAPIMQYPLDGSVQYVYNQGHGQNVIFPSMQAHESQDQSPDPFCGSLEQQQHKT